MRGRWLRVVTVMAMFVGGCEQPSAPPLQSHDSKTAPHPSSSESSAIEGQILASPVEAPAAKSAGGSAAAASKSVEKPPPARATDDFGLPLVIVLETPEVPPEIRGPSPPIQAEPAKP